MADLKYRRVLLKLSGEALAGELKTGINPDTVDTLAKRLKEKITAKNGISMDDVTIIYVDSDGNESTIAPTQKGNYTFKLSVKAAANGSYTATEQPLTSDDWTFSINPYSYALSVTGGYAYTLRDDGSEHYLSSELGIYPDTKIYLKLDSEHANDTNFEFKGWQVVAGSTSLGEGTNYDLTLKEGSYFIMPNGNVKLALITNSDEPDQTPDSDPITPVDSGAGTAAAVVLGGAAIGGVAYLAGTQLYLESVLPKGAAIPVNRQQLAELLWTTAGKPQPLNSVLFTDISAEAIDSQKAARWCVEQGLMQADGTSFKPSRYTFRLQVIKAWNDLQAMQKAG